jgi:hypothetical protein
MDLMSQNNLMLWNIMKNTWKSSIQRKYNARINSKWEGNRNCNCSQSEYLPSRNWNRKTAPNENKHTLLKRLHKQQNDDKKAQKVVCFWELFSGREVKRTHRENPFSKTMASNCCLLCVSFCTSRQTLDRPQMKTMQQMRNMAQQTTRRAKEREKKLMKIYMYIGTCCNDGIIFPCGKLENWRQTQRWRA